MFLPRDRAFGCCLVFRNGARPYLVRFLGELSGPLLDRIDLHVSVQSIPYVSLMQAQRGESTAVVRTRVAAAFERATERQGSHNASLAGERLTQHATLDDAGTQFLQAIAARLNWSARRLHRVLRVARTIADLGDSAGIMPAHLAEAVKYQRVLQA